MTEERVDLFSTWKVLRNKGIFEGVQHKFFDNLDSQQCGVTGQGGTAQDWKRVDYGSEKIRLGT